MPQKKTLINGDSIQKSGSSTLLMKVIFWCHLLYLSGEREKKSPPRKKVNIIEYNIFLHLFFSPHHHQCAPKMEDICHVSEPRPAFVPILSYTP